MQHLFTCEFQLVHLFANKTYKLYLLDCSILVLRMGLRLQGIPTMPGIVLRRDSYCSI